MPEFLEKALRKEYGDNPNAIYGTMNKIGAMHGNKETAKGREMEKKHMAKESADGAPHDLRSMRIEVMRGKGKKGKHGPVTGHIAHHEHEPTRSKGGAFISEEHEAYPFDGEGNSEQHGHLLDHIAHHLGMGSGDQMENPKPKESPGEVESEDEEA